MGYQVFEVVEPFEASKKFEASQKLDNDSTAEEQRSALLAEAGFARTSDNTRVPSATQEKHERWPMPRSVVVSPLSLELSKEEKERIGKKVWKNESGGTIEGLTAWNKGEEFPSLGIGHFIWMPKGVETPFGQSFPEAMNFVKDHGGNWPSWLKPDEPCPWNTRKQFMNEFNGKKLTELRQFLADTVPQQTDYLIDRLERALPRILEKEKDNPALQQKVQDRFYRVLNSGPAGVFALVDYVNFKGEGLELIPSYNNISWGLRQVLEGMKDTDNPVKDFSDSAKDVLTRRVDNSPPERNEKQWLKGWHNRVERYVTDPPFMPLQKPVRKK